MEIAHPLSPALVQRLEPWLAESRRRRQIILDDNWAADAGNRIERRVPARSGGDARETGRRLTKDRVAELFSDQPHNESTVVATATSQLRRQGIA